LNDLKINLLPALQEALYPPSLCKTIRLLLGRVSAIRQREQDFIRHAAHELRTPIAGLQATTELALSKPREVADYCKHLESCRQTATELGDLVKRLSALSRIGQKNYKPQIISFDCGKIINQCVEAFQPLFVQRSLWLKLQLPSVPMTVTGDFTFLKIIFNNLLDNALSYTPADSDVRIRCEVFDG